MTNVDIWPPPARSAVYFNEWANYWTFTYFPNMYVLHISSGLSLSYGKEYTHDVLTFTVTFVSFVPLQSVPFVSLS